jgi:tetratricopeptide (TPR) repeat protein
VVTCAHVVETVLGVHPREAGEAEVGVYFPQARGGEVKDHRARVARCLDQHDDDVVLLQLAGGAPPLGPEQMPALGRAAPSTGNPFRSYGYRKRDVYQAGHAHGTILGCVECPPGRNLLSEPVELQSPQIDRGMSGAAVLDIERNLVVGIIAEGWRPRGSFRDRDAGWAVDARVLSLDPLGLPLHDGPLAKGAAPQPRADVAAARANAARDPGVEWNGAPPPLPEWTGRAGLLAALDRDWADPERRVTGLIGFGGEGKSSLARRWVENLRATHLGGASHVPDGVFWWGFYDRPSVDEFFEAALEWLAGARIDVRKLPGASIRAQVIGAMLGAGSYLFVLDGLEVMQHQEGDQYGLLRSNDLRDFLALFAAPGHDSFCLLTSRAPVLDLMAYTTYHHRDVERLSAADGRALLRNLGVQGPDGALDRVVAEWDGHALTLGLLGGCLADRHGGDVARIDEVPPPTADDGSAPLRYERVHRVLRRYDEHLTAAERAFLVLFSAFRTPVKESAFDRVFRQTSEVGRTGGSPETSEVWAPLAALDDEAFAALVARLVAYRLLRHDAGAGTYTAHPLVRSHYFAQLTTGDRAGQQDAHERIRDYYLELAGDTPRFPTLDDLAPLIEVVHHACRAGAYDEAHRIRRDRLYQSNRRVLVNPLGAWETALVLMLEFFPGGDTSREPLVSDPKHKSWILNEAGLCLMNLGRLAEAVPFYERANAMDAELEDWSNASIGYQNLAELHAHLGALAASAEAAGQALALARRAEDKEDEYNSLCWQAWISHLRGNVEDADKTFGQAEALKQEIEPDKRYMYSLPGIWHGDHLRRSGRAGEARRVTEANLEICQQNRWADDLSRCHRVLGDLDADADAGDPDAARAHYDRALEIARGIDRRDVLIEALLARGRWTAQDPEGFENPQGLVAATADLEEALGYALEGGYRIYEADARTGLAWAQLAAGDRQRARAEAARARGMSEGMGYHWGVVDADEVLAVIGSG